MNELSITGSIESAPQTGYPAGPASVSVSVEERQYSSVPVTAQYTLAADAQVSVALGPLSAANALHVRPVGGEVLVRITTSHGTLQVIPVDSLLILSSRTTNITAITLQRPAGVEVVVDVLLAAYD
jgi:hypothetical protein